jgi:ribonucleoside-diphosphate reductase subunit M2
MDFQEEFAKVANVPKAKEDINEPILKEENFRLTVFPLKPEYKQIWNLYKDQVKSFWTAEEIDFSKDKADFETLDKKEQEAIEMMLAFFAASDGIVNFNLRERFMNDVKIMEAQIAYAFQMMMENIHGEVYSQMLENIVSDVSKRTKLFNAIKEINTIKAMADWAFKWIDSSESFAHRVVAFACVEGIFFSGAFATIFWLKKYRGQGRAFMNGLTKSNEFIARDEGMHTNFACMLYHLLNEKLSRQTIVDMVTEAVTISTNFTNESITEKFVGMNKDSMSQYLQYIADRLIVMLGYDKHYNSENPFDFMETIGMSRKTNFFEHRPTEYQNAFNEENNNAGEFRILADF